LSIIGQHTFVTRYKAPWSATLIIVSSLATIICLFMVFSISRFVHRALLIANLLPLIVILGALPFIIRGYIVTPDAILVRQLFWVKRLPLKDLLSANFELDAMRGSIRTFGNGGMFSFTGLFRNKSLGGYRAFVTDQHRTVVLRYSDRTIVISPEKPEEFVRSVNLARGLSGLQS